MTVWTPKRVVLLLAGFAFYLTSYGVYASFLGGIDGLPPLREVDWPGQVSGVEQLPAPKRENQANVKLQHAFGPESDVLRRLIKVEADNGLVLATDDFQIQNDGRVKLEPFPGGLFGQSAD